MDFYIDEKDKELGRARLSQGGEGASAGGGQGGGGRRGARARGLGAWGGRAPLLPTPRPALAPSPPWLTEQRASDQPNEDLRIKKVVLRTCAPACIRARGIISAGYNTRP